MYVHTVWLTGPFLVRLSVFTGMVSATIHLCTSQPYNQPTCPPRYLAPSPSPQVLPLSHSVLTGNTAVGWFANPTETWGRVILYVTT